MEHISKYLDKYKDVEQGKIVAYAGGFKFVDNKQEARAYLSSKGISYGFFDHQLIFANTK